MTPKDFQAVRGFCEMAEAPDLLSFFDIEATSSDEAVAAAIEEKRRWAQGQQANPKYRSQAIWLIKNLGLVKRVLLESRSSYSVEVRRQRTRERLEILEQFIRGSLSDKQLTPEKEKAILERGRELDIEAPRVQETLEELTLLLGAERKSGHDTGEIKGFVDYYQLLEVSPDATPIELEEAYRGRHRYASELLNKADAERLRADLDQAWKILRSKKTRQRYDAARLKALGMSVEEAVTGPTEEIVMEGSYGDDVVGYLPAPEAAPPEDDPVFGLNPGAAARIAPEPEPEEDEPTPAPEEPKRGGARIDWTPDTPVYEREPPPAPLAPEGQMAKLSLIGSKEREYRVGWKPHRSDLDLLNEGEAPMKGKITAAAAWLEVKPEFFFDVGPNQTHTSKIVVFPRLMPSRVASSSVSVSTDHGERRTISVTATRPRLGPRARAFVLIGGLLAALGGGAYAALAMGLVP